MNLPDRIADELLVDRKHPAAFRVMLAVARHQSDDNLGVRRLATLAGVCLESADTAIKYCQERGWLEPYQRKIRTYYRIPQTFYSIEQTSDNNVLIDRTLSASNVLLDRTIEDRSTEQNDPEANVLPVRTPRPFPCPGTAVATRKRDKGTPPKKSKKTSDATHQRRGADAPAAPDRSPEDDKLEEFDRWLEAQPDTYRTLFEYVAPAVGAPYRTTSAKKRRDAASVVRMILVDGCTLDEFKAVRAAYAADPWRDKHSGKPIPLNPAILRERWATLAAAVRAGPADEPQVAEVIELPTRGRGSNGHEPKTFQERRDELNRERNEHIDRRIEDELAGATGGSIAAAPARGRLGDSSEGASGSGEGSTGTDDPRRPTRYLG